MTGGRGAGAPGVKAVSVVSREIKEASVLRPLLRRIYPAAAVLSAVCFGVTLFWGFDWRQIIGFAAGYGYMCLCYEYLARTCERAVTLEKSRAVSAMRICYAVRFGGLFLLCAAAMLSRCAAFTGILIPQFFPRIILTYIQLRGDSEK